MIPKCYNAGREVLHMKKDRRIAFNILTSLLSIMNQNDESNVDCVLAKYLLEHLDEIPRLSIYDLADACYVSRSSIHRFVRSCGYESFREFKKASVDEVSDKVAEAIREVIARRADVMVKQAWPIIEQIYTTQGAAYENIAIPVSDGSKILQLVINLKKAYENQGMELYKAMAKSVTLIMIDEYWKEHLRDMDDLKQSVQNATYEQKDPLLIYKFESFNLFKGILEKISRDVLAFMTRAHIPLRHRDDEIPVREQQQRKRTDLSRMQTSRNDLVTNGGEPKSNAPVHVEKRVGRNDPCPCGSGKKFKNCHGKEN
jgi:preprotein translocase subunit SecA